MHPPLKSDVLQYSHYLMRIINCFCFPSFVAYKYSVKEFYKRTEGNPGLMGLFSK